MIVPFFLVLIFFCNSASAEFAEDFKEGAIRGVGIAAGVPTSALAASEKGVLGHLQRQAITQGVTAGINLATGTKPEEALRTAALGSVAGVLGGIGANYISRVFDAKLIDSFSHKLAHSVLGAGTGAILAGGRGAVAGAIAAPIVETIAIMMKESPNVTMAKAVEKAQGQGIEITKESLSELIEEELRTTLDLAKLGAAITALIASQDVGVAIAVGTNAVENNCSLSEVKACLSAYAQTVAEQLDVIKTSLQELASDQLERVADILEHHPEQVEVCAALLLSSFAVAQSDRLTRQPLATGVNPRASKAEQLKKNGMVAALKAAPKYFKDFAKSLRAGKGNSTAIAPKSVKKIVRFADEAAPHKITDATAHPSLPIGNRVSKPTPKFPSSNTPSVINGRTYRGHALDEMRTQGIMPSAVESTIKNGITKQGRDISTQLKYDPVNNISVILNIDSQAVVTVSFGQLKGF